MRKAVRRTRKTLVAVWWWLRQMSGDAAYENYLRAARANSGAGSAEQPLSREEFYVDALRRRYSGVSRCC
jgi:uncharacterized short protein YbdD (DUF466 family)